ncbi:MAG: DUF3870 domain-containing protein [Desulfitobacteriaceae bacterium]|nr:DUF3870 domain-containing protein [Desulfitobacteriaceae bacterium]MDI6880586.1 DUF3870 domain-containing protein [Desulfitobacteriaceae bacterium]MDI6914636.1 DUF3870 domain-containing protein [Desulfitobacteriaceae bacterium]
MSQRRTVMIAGHANLPQGMAAKSLFGTLAIVTEVDRKYGVIVSATCTLVTQQAQDFLSTILVGSSLNDGIEPLIEEIKEDYHGAAQNALIAALKDVHRTYLTLLK